MVQVSKPQHVTNATAPEGAPQEVTRSALFAVRLTPAELRAVRIAAARCDKKPAEYVRALVLPTALREAA
jgi:hypothetical protein